MGSINRTNDSLQSLPPFPSGLREAQITKLSLRKLLEGDATEADRIFESCSTSGFFYMDLRDCETGRALLDASEDLLQLSKDAFALPTHEKEAVAASKMRSLFGYKGPGITAASDPHKRKDRGEFWNISKDDIMAAQSSIPYPDVIMQAVPGVLRPFCRRAHGVGMEVLRALASRAGIPADELAGRHRFGAASGDHARLTFGPGGDEAPPADEARTAITTFAHTDFGSVTLLFNWLGGLQIEDRRSGAWEWVRPAAGHAICNLGDAAVVFSGGRLASGKHRVVVPPGAQARPPRYSLVYFVRPEDEVVLEDLTVPAAERGRDGEKRWTAREWIEAKARSLGNTLNDKK